VLTSDLGVARQGYERATASVPATAPTNNLKKRGKLLFLGLVVRDGFC
jgi:hypothetical protein